MQDLEERVERLEVLFNKLLEAVNNITDKLDKLVSDVSASFKLVFELFKETDKRMEESLIREREEREKRIQEEVRAWNEKLEKEREEREIRFKEEHIAWQEKFEQEKREDRKKWEELILKLGTVVEDIVAPSMENIAKKYFGCVDVYMEAIRVKRRNIKDKSKLKEFDYILLCDDIIVLNETKSNPRSEYAKDFAEFVESGEFWDYFPEYKDKRFIPIFSTLYMPDNIVSYLSSHNIYAVGMKGDEMDILNFKDVKR